jgi:hypothetical protein
LPALQACDRRGFIRAPSVDDLDGDFAFESLELIERGVIGAEMDRVVRVADSLGVVVEAEVAPRDEVDEVTALRVGARRAAVPELSREVADLLPARELLESDRQRGIERKSRTAGLSSPMVTSTDAAPDESRTTVPTVSRASLSALVVVGDGDVGCVTDADVWSSSDDASSVRSEPHPVWASNTNRPIANTLIL